MHYEINDRKMNRPAGILLLLDAYIRSVDNEYIY